MAIEMPVLQKLAKNESVFVEDDEPGTGACGAPAWTFVTKKLLPVPRKVGPINLLSRSGSPTPPPSGLENKTPLARGSVDRPMLALGLATYR